MTEKLAAVYDPEEHEEELYEWWEKQGYFRPEKQVELGLATEDGPRWCITMPPPNVTGALHLGHAMVAAVEDLMTRYHRMRGEQTLYLPGTDHAGIATQNVVERELAKEGLSRQDLGREKFVERAWEWKEVYQTRITHQQRRLGVSCDWTRERFTLDEGLSRAVRTAFVRLYKKGLIYQGSYLVNWCPRCESAISDLEVIPVERHGHLWTIRYPVVNEDWDGPRHEWTSGRWAWGQARRRSVATDRPAASIRSEGGAPRPAAAWSAARTSSADTRRMGRVYSPPSAKPFPAFLQLRRGPSSLAPPGSDSPRWATAHPPGRAEGGHDADEADPTTTRRAGPRRSGRLPRRGAARYGPRSVRAARSESRARPRAGVRARADRPGPVRARDRAGACRGVVPARPGRPPAAAGTPSRGPGSRRGVREGIRCRGRRSASGRAHPSRPAPFRRRPASRVVTRCPRRVRGSPRFSLSRTGSTRSARSLRA